MQKAKRFEDLIGWQKARVLTKTICQISKQGLFAYDYGLSGQIQRAAVSIMSNIAEGFERGNPGDYHRFLTIAKASCGEVRSQLYVALDTGYLDQNQFDNLLKQAEEVSGILSGLIASVSRSRS
jgi:four helix bundle protein